MKRGLYILLLILGLLILSRTSSALGVSPQKFEIDFKPLEEYNLSVRIINTQEYNFTARVAYNGELSQYITHEKDIYHLAPKEIATHNLVLKLPDRIKTPGINTIDIIISEVPPEGSQGVAVTTLLSVPIRIKVPMPGKYIEFSLSSENINDDEKPKAKIRVENKGLKDVASARAFFDIVHEEETIETYKSSQFDLEVGSMVDMESDFTSILKAGMYKIRSYLFYDGISSKSLESEFKVGTLSVNITDYSKEIESKKISKFLMKFESNWNGVIEGIHADLRLISKGAQVSDVIKTQSFSLQSFGKAEINVYLDATKLEPGNYTLEASVLYQGNEQKFLLPVNLIKHEEPGDINFILIVVILIILAADFIWMIFRRKVRKELKELRRYKDSIG